MDFIEWNSAYSVGVEELDKHHSRLFELANELWRAMEGTPDQEELRGYVTELASYAGMHFKAEEEHMLEVGFGGLKEHREEHAKLLAAVRSFIARLERGERVSFPELLDFVTDWLKDHILNEDRKYAAQR